MVILGGKIGRSHVAAALKASSTKGRQSLIPTWSSISRPLMTRTLGDIITPPLVGQPRIQQPPYHGLIPTGFPLHHDPFWAIAIWNWHPSRALTIGCRSSKIDPKESVTTSRMGPCTHPQLTVLSSPMTISANRPHLNLEVINHLTIRLGRASGEPDPPKHEQLLQVGWYDPAAIDN